MKTNEILQKDVQDAIKWEPLLSAAEIGVTVKDGVVTLSGTVDSYAKKLEAETATKNVAGVKAVVEKIEIKLNDTAKREDSEIATDILSAFKWNWKVPQDRVTIKVEAGWVTLGGIMEWYYQKEAAKQSVSNVAGVKNVANFIKIESVMLDEIDKKDVERALHLNWSIDDRDISVKVMGHHVTLEGTVFSLYQKEQATRIAWNAPGVMAVDNDLIIESTI